MARPIRVLELRSVRGTGGGPEKTILLGAARADRSRFAVPVCYIRDLRDDVFEIDRRARASAVDYVEISERHSFDPAIWGALRRLVHERQIDIVHAHDYKTDLLAWALADRVRRPSRAGEASSQWHRSRGLQARSRRPRIGAARSRTLSERPGDWHRWTPRTRQASGHPARGGRPARASVADRRRRLGFVPSRVGRACESLGARRSRALAGAPKRRQGDPSELRRLR